MIRIRLLATILALASLALITAAWPEAYAGLWQWIIPTFTLVLWFAALWTRIPLFAGIALFIGFILAAVLMSMGANELMLVASACLTLAAWTHSRILQIAPPQAESKHEMVLARKLILYSLLMIGISLALAALALNIALPMPFFFAFVSAGLLLFLATRLIIWLRQIAS